MSKSTLNFVVDSFIRTMNRNKLIEICYITKVENYNNMYIFITFKSFHKKHRMEKYKIHKEE